MDNFSHGLICRHKFELQDLMDSYPPQLHNANKKIVYSIACQTGSTYGGQLVFSRWWIIPFPQSLSCLEHQPRIDEWKGYFGYESSEDSARVEWYLNFAHCDIFCAYGGPLFAQDEMQVAEHPALGSLREALLDKGITPLTVENGQPTPVLIRGAERRCAIATDPNPKEGRPYGLYGNNFARATPEAIKQATQLLDPPTITNIIAMEAPSGGYGSYTLEQIEYVFVTAFTGFSAARIESELALGQQPDVIIHTGFWGCGAYGGNRILMALLQLLAARLSQVDCLAFHVGDSAGSKALASAQQLLKQLLDSDDREVRISALIGEIYEMRFQWGVSDGN
jgi:Poly (ADP-ribose) glycohydrolase (PARG)